MIPGRFYSSNLREVAVLESMQLALLCLINSKHQHPPSPPLELFLCLGSQAFDLKGYPGGRGSGIGNLTLPGWGGEFEPEVSSLKYLLLASTFKRMWLFQSMEQFKGFGEDITFVSKWLTEKGLTKLCSVFE